MSVSSFAGAAGGLQPYEQIFTSSGTWTKPTGVKTVEITAIGGGGGGGSVAAYGASAGGYYKGIVDVSAISTLPITIGAGGTYNTANWGNTGGSTLVGSLIACSGGGRDAGALYDPSTAGSFSPATGTTVSTTGTMLYTNQANLGLIGYGAGKYIMLPGANHVNATGVAACQYSTDGISWSWGSGISTTTSYGDVVFGNGKFVATGLTTYSATTQIATSTDGITWTQSTAAIGADKIAFGAGKFVTCGANSGGTVGAIYYSTNGTTWTAATINRTSQPSETSIFYGKPIWDGTKFILLPSTTSTYGYAYQSTDGVTWNQYALAGFYGFNNNNYHDTAYFNGRYYVGATTASGSVASYSSDGVSWVPSGFGSSYINRFISSSGVMIITCANAAVSVFTQIYLSVDGLTIGPNIAANNVGTVGNGNGTTGAVFNGVINGTTILIGSTSTFEGTGMGPSVNYWKFTCAKLLQSGYPHVSYAGVPGPGSGVMGVATQQDGAYVRNAIGGPGDEYGWGMGGHTNSAPFATSPGSGGSPGYPGRSGGVRIRWWA